MSLHNRFAAEFYWWRVLCRYFCLSRISMQSILFVYVILQNNLAMKILSITIKSGEIINLNKFTLLVGPNNVGKSQTLKDIYKKLTKNNERNTTIVSSVKVNRPASFDELLDGLDVKPDSANYSYSTIDGLTSSPDASSLISVPLDHHRGDFESRPEADFTYLNLGKFRAFYLDSESRLKLASKTGNYIPHESSPKNFLQALYGSLGTLDGRLQEAFKSTFGMDIKLDYSSGLELRLAVAKVFEPIPKDPREAYPLMKKYSSIELQGDGFRSFVAVVLTLLLSKDKVVLLDEPEAFLHPEQARRLGKWISDHIDSFPCQIIITSHNANFLAGVLSGRQPADIYRLNRINDLTIFNKITAEATQSLSTSPLLSSQRVLEAIFAKGVVVCESDADRIIYNTVAIKEHDNQEILFLHSHNKQTIKQVVALLRKASIPTVGIVDIDILNSSSEFSNALTEFVDDEDFSEVAALRNEIAGKIENSSEEDVLEEIKKKTWELLEQLKNGEHTLSGARSALDRIKSESTKWAKLKKYGVRHLEGDLKRKAEKIIEFCASFGFFIVPVGELESWIELDVKKNRWVIPALDAIHKGECPGELSAFVDSIQKFILLKSS